jgi:hypothetical protein
MKRRGRPRRTGPAPLKDGAIASTWLTTADYDKLYKTAQAKDVSLSSLLRVWVKRNLSSS